MSMRSRKVLYSGSSPYGTYKVVDGLYDGRPARVLFGDAKSPQSGMATDDEPELLFDYNQRFLEMVMSMQPKRILVIGGGVFMLPTAVFERFPSVHIDVVEIDELLVDIARDYFHLPIDPRMDIYIGDGRHFIEQTKHTYDLIIIDAFTGYSIPHHLIELNAIKQYRHKLSKDGLVAINFISEFRGKKRRLAHDLVDEFSEVFPYVEFYQAEPSFATTHEQNLLLVAGQKETPLDYLQSSGVRHLMSKV